jgi:hypothetical protein
MVDDQLISLQEFERKYRKGYFKTTASSSKPDSRRLFKVDKNLFRFFTAKYMKDNKGKIRE